MASDSPLVDYAEPLILAEKALAKVQRCASLRQYRSAREHVAEAAEHLVELETALNAMEAGQRMGRIVRDLQGSE